MSEVQFASRMKALDRETSLQVLARARALEATGREIVHLEIGEPDFDTADHIKEAAVQALRDGYTHYGPSAGLPEARGAIAEFITRDRGVSVAPDQVVITPGAKPLILFSMLALVESGDEVIFPSPGFPNYEMCIEFIGAKPVPIPLEEDGGFSIDPDRLASLVTSKTRLCVINSPHNPTGGILKPDVMKAILDLSEKHDFYVLSDEIYSKIVYDEIYESYYALPGAAERTILLEGHSKTYAMTGWRLGYGVMPTRLAAQVTRVMGNANSCTCSFTQMAGIAALQGPQDSVEKMVEEFRARRELIVDGINRVPGFHCHKPAGAFYAFPSIKGTGMKSDEVADVLMEKAGVSVLAGTTFGSFGEGYVRMSYANSQENLRRAIDKMVAVFGA